MGSAEPRSFTRGKRGIAGTLVFTVFDRDALIGALKEEGEKNFHRVLGNQNMQPMSIDQWDQSATNTIGGVNNSAGTDSLAGDATNSPSWQYAQNVTEEISNKEANIFYADEIPPFNITVSFANEYGQKATLVIYGVEILNEAIQFGIDNVTTEKAYTFVARKIDYMRAYDPGAINTGSGNETNKGGEGDSVASSSAISV